LKYCETSTNWKTIAMSIAAGAFEKILILHPYVLNTLNEHRKERYIQREREFRQNIGLIDFHSNMNDVIHFNSAQFLNVYLLYQIYNRKINVDICIKKIHFEVCIRRLLQSKNTTRWYFFIIHVSQSMVCLFNYFNWAIFTMLAKGI